MINFIFQDNWPMWAFASLLISLHVLVTFGQYLTGSKRREEIFILAHV